MNNISITFMLCLIAMLATPAQAEINLVTVSKIEPNLYRTSDGLYIETSSCFVEAAREVAVLDYEQYACNNTLRIGKGKVCKVQYVFK